MDWQDSAHYTLVGYCLSLHAFIHPLDDTRMLAWQLKKQSILSALPSQASHCVQFRIVSLGLGLKIATRLCHFMLIDVAFQLHFELEPLFPTLLLISLPRVSPFVTAEFYFLSQLN